MVGVGKEALHADAVDEPFRVVACHAASVVVAAVVVASVVVAVVECEKQGVPWQQPSLAQPCQQSQECQVVLMTVVVVVVVVGDADEKVAMWVACLVDDAAGALDGPS